MKLTIRKLGGKWRVSWISFIEGRAYTINEFATWDEAMEEAEMVILGPYYRA